MNRKYRVLLEGYYGFGNTGDEATCSVLLSRLRSETTDVVILSTSPERSTELHGVPSCKDKFTSLQFIRAFLAANMVMFGGGGRYGARTIRRMCILALLAKLFGKRVVFQNVGVYPHAWFETRTTPRPLPSLFKRVLMLLTFSLADAVTVRDPYTKAFLRATGVSRQIAVGADLALSLPPLNLARSRELFARYVPPRRDGALVLGVNLRTLRDDVNDKLVAAVASALDRVIAEHDVDVVFAPFGYGHDAGRFWDDDVRIARQLRARVTQKERFRIVDTEFPPAAVLGLFQLFDAFLGVRFHSIVFAEVVDVPTVALVYDTKVEAFVAQRPWIDALWFDACSAEAIFNRLSRKICEAREQRNRPVRDPR